MLQVLDSDEKVSVMLVEKLGKKMPDAILVSATLGFQAVERALKNGGPVIAYGPDPHSLGTTEYLGAFDGCKQYAYVNFPSPDSEESFLANYKHIVEQMKEPVVRLRRHDVINVKPKNTRRR